ncbi:MAG TPA: thiamine diphosphokinase [Bacillota bacterium]
MKRGLIIAGGPVSLGLLQAELAAKPDLVIAADGGGKYLLEVGEFPDLLIGDFDSLPSDELQQIAAGGSEIHRFPVEKDQTDLELAVAAAIQNHVTALRILGGLGRRLDHTLANIGLLQQAWQSGVTASLIDTTQELYLTGDHIVIPAKPGWALSLIPLTPVAKGVTTLGLKYPLEDAWLYSAATRGIHNQFLTAEAVVTVNEGLLLIVTFQED